MTQIINGNSKAVVDKFAAQLGELAQHELSKDPNVLETSEWYLRIFKEVLKRHHNSDENPNPRYLEIATYRHIMGYKLASESGFDSTLFDISDRDLRLGRDLALEQNLVDSVDRVAGDFHDLPFADNYFDFAYVSASLHHTLQPEAIISEMLRVLRPGGIFYCQREPCERLFCFYLFNANRPAQHTAMESKLSERDTLRLFSSPFHGARNADVFARVENDRIPLDYYYQVFAKYGEIVEQVLYHDGLLTRLDKEILEQDDLSLNALTDFIYEKVAIEVDVMNQHIGPRDVLLGYRAPSSVSIMGMSRRVANALKSRPEDKTSLAWQQSMVKIFGGNLRFVVKKVSPDNQDRNSKLKNSRLGSLWDAATRKLSPKYRRDCKFDGGVYYDENVFTHSALKLWEKLLPDMQTASPSKLYKSAFPESDWLYHKSDTAGMISKAATPGLRLEFSQSVVVVIRYRIIVCEINDAATLNVKLDDTVIQKILIPQTEDRLMRIASTNKESRLEFSLRDSSGDLISLDSMMYISIMQCIPIDTQKE